MQALVKHGLNAFHTIHLPLPVSTGSYITVKTRRTLTTTNYLELFAPTKSFSTPANADDWTGYCGISNAISTNLMNSASWTYRGMPSPGTDVGGLFECVPAAYSIQVISPAALTTAAGVVHIGRLKGSISNPESTDSRTVGAFGDALLSFSNPKTMPVARLAVNAVQINAIPSNLSELQDFETMTEATADTVSAWTAATALSCFNPIYIVNPNAAQLNVTICVEWRVRVSPFNPMHASGTHHPPTSDSLWHRILSAADTAGHGVEDVGVVGGAGYFLAGGTESAMAGALGGLAGYAATAFGALEYAAPLLLL